MEKYVVSYDIGTTGVKTCLFRIDQIITLLESASMGYGLTVLENGGVEQNVDEWWEAMCVTTKKIFAESSVKPEQIDGISFCSQAGLKWPSSSLSVFVFQIFCSWHHVLCSNRVSQPWLCLSPWSDSFFICLPGLAFLS